jgi:hypothetical protein
LTLQEQEGRKNDPNNRMKQFQGNATHAEKYAQQERACCEDFGDHVTLLPLASGRHVDVASCQNLLELCFVSTLFFQKLSLQSFAPTLFLQSLLFSNITSNLLLRSLPFRKFVLYLSFKS